MILIKVNPVRFIYGQLHCNRPVQNGFPINQNHSCRLTHTNKSNKVVKKVQISGRVEDRMYSFPFHENMGIVYEWRRERVAKIVFGRFFFFRKNRLSFPNEIKSKTISPQNLHLLIFYINICCIK